MAVTWPSGRGDLAAGVTWCLIWRVAGPVAVGLVYGHRDGSASDHTLTGKIPCPQCGSKPPSQ